MTPRRRSLPSPSNLETCIEDLAEGVRTSEHEANSPRSTNGDDKTGRAAIPDKKPLRENHNERSGLPVELNEEREARDTNREKDSASQQVPAQLISGQEHQTDVSEVNPALPETKPADDDL